MKLLALGLALVVSSFSAQAESRDIDLEKVNSVLSKIGNSLIENDTLFTELGAKFDVENTDLKAQKIQASARAAVSQTAWSPEEASSLELAGAFEVLSEGEEGSVRAVAHLGATLDTSVVDMLKYFYMLFGSEPPLPSEGIPYAADYVREKSIPYLNEVIPALTDGQSLASAVVGYMAQLDGFVDEYIEFITQKMAETQDEEEKLELEHFLRSGQDFKEELERIEVSNRGDSVLVRIALEDVFAEQVFIDLDIHGNQLVLSLSGVQVFPKAFVDEIFGFLGNLLSGLQSESQELIEDVTAQLSGYLEFVRAFISAE